MTTINGAKVAIANHFKNNWTDTSVEYTFDNIYSQFNDGDKSWIGIKIQPVTGEQTSIGDIGNRVFRRYGLLTFSVFTLEGTGTESNDLICQDILDLFDGIHLSGIWFRDGGVNLVGTDAKWFQQNVQFTFIFDEIK